MVDSKLEDSANHAGEKIAAAAAAVQDTAKVASDEGEAAIKSRFSKAIDDARASAESLRSDAADLAANARKKAAEQASALASQSRDMGLDLARQGKDKTSDAIVAVSRAISDTAPVIDEKLGVTYGNYARSAAGALENSADRLANKDLTELGDDVKAFVRTSPATALGIAAVTGFLLARIFSRSGGDNA
ncbi:hypothetical protein [Novosphingobium sp.]|uniref:hypothetical protein n=1 Tax=Novosphingobium sp. TaxID=1874826 RepID=UPI003B52CABB